LKKLPKKLNGTPYPEPPKKNGIGIKDHLLPIDELDPLPFTVLDLLVLEVEFVELEKLPDLVPLLDDFGAEKLPDFTLPELCEPVDPFAYTTLLEVALFPKAFKVIGLNTFADIRSMDSIKTKKYFLKLFMVFTPLYKLPNKYEV
jgi:hypothetical protein